VEISVYSSIFGDYIQQSGYINSKLRTDRWFERFAFAWDLTFRVKCYKKKKSLTVYR
jgi:hypothetical protein